MTLDALHAEFGIRPAPHKFQRIMDIARQTNLDPREVFLRLEFQNLKPEQVLADTKETPCQR